MISLTIWLDSCKKDDTDNPGTTTGLEGTYKITALKSNPKVGGVYEDLLAAAPLILTTTCMSDIKITFATGGNVTTDNPTTCQKSAIPPSTITGIDGSSKWTLNGSTLTITRADNTTTTYNVLKTGSVAQLQWQSREDFLGTGTKVDYTFTMDLTRQ
ncbi:lipocalin family protein [Spirosoma harenae]